MNIPLDILRFCEKLENSAKMSRHARLSSRYRELNEAHHEMDNTAVRSNEIQSFAGSSSVHRERRRSSSRRRSAGSSSAHRETGMASSRRLIERRGSAGSSGAHEESKSRPSLRGVSRPSSARLEIGKSSTGRTRPDEAMNLVANLIWDVNRDTGLTVELEYLQRTLKSSRVRRSTAKTIATGVRKLRRKVERRDSDSRRAVQNLRENVKNKRWSSL